MYVLPLSSHPSAFASWVFNLSDKDDVVNNVLI